VKRLTLPLTVLIALFWAALQPAEILSFSAPFMDMRRALTLLSGALAFGWMGVGMLLALRPSWLERSLGGLDKLYATHKWTGIGAVLLVVTHWLLILSPRTLAAWGWIEALGRREHGPGHGAEGQSLVGLAHEMGEWAAWLMIGLGIVALLRFVPYGWFRKLHKGFPIAFLIGAFHSVVMLPNEILLTPFGLLNIVIALVGTPIALISLLGRIGRHRQHAGQIKRASTTATGILDLDIAPGAEWPGHEAGQFALLTFDKSEGAHPFSIVSDWSRGANLRFAIKPLGDYTRRLPGLVKAGDAVTIEGPYGRFDFGEIGHNSEAQVWVAGGIGVAPFIARLEALAAAGGGAANIHFFYAVRTRQDASFPVGLEDLCKRAGVELHLRVDERDGQITADEIGRFVRQAGGVWFCGPAAWARSLQAALQRNFGLPAARFHRELFEFR